MLKQAASFSLISLGCARTLVDSEKLVDSLQNKGFTLVAEGSGEPITILNTCSFIQSAIDETESNIVDLISQKKQGKIRYLAVVGCYVSRFKKEDLQTRFPQVDIWLNTQEEDQLEQELSMLVFQHKFTPTTSRHSYIKLTPSHFAYIKLSEGCDNWCSFCTIPKIRGKHTSKPLDAILKEAQLQISFGAQELLLIAEDTTCWGQDLFGKPSLPLLLRELACLPVRWIRPMYIFPSRVDDDFISVLADFPDKYNYVDMPIQHCNSALLKAMNRSHDKQHLTKILKEMRSANTKLSLRTTLIAGFPGETDAQFEELVEFIQEHRFSHIGCFGYSEEKETRSARMEPKLAPTTIQNRIKRLMAAQKSIAHHHQSERIGKSFDVVIEPDGTARSYWEAPDVDSKIIPVNPKLALKPGSWHKATGIAPQGYDLVAEITQSL